MSASTHLRGSFAGHALESPSGVPREALRAISLHRPRAQARTPIIQAERSWRRPEIFDGERLVATRWMGNDLDEKTSEITGDFHMLSVSLAPTEFSIWLGKRAVPHKQVVPGIIQLTSPGVPARIVYHKGYDVLHVFIQNALLKESFEWYYGKSPVGDVVLRDPNYNHDPLIGQLSVALLAADDFGDSCGELYADAISLAIIARLFAFYAEKPGSAAQRSIASLPNWRLKRAIDFIEAHESEPISLADLAAISGLSRMHFAAQFRKATGLRPHEYLLRHRIEKAKTLLGTTSLPIVDVALSVGFNSQPHFTEVFKRFAGVTPRRWRECCRL